MPEQLIKLINNKGMRLAQSEYSVRYPYFKSLIGAKPATNALEFGYGPRLIASFTDKGTAGENVLAWREILDRIYITTDGGLYLDGTDAKLFEYARGTLTKVQRQYNKDILFFDKGSGFDGRCWVEGGTTRREVLYQESWTNPASNIYAINLKPYHIFTGIETVYLEDSTPDAGSNTELTEVTAYASLDTNHQWYYDHDGTGGGGAGTQTLYIYEDTIDPTTEHFTVVFDVNYVSYSDPEYGILPGFPHFGETSYQYFTTALDPSTVTSAVIDDLSDTTGCVDSGYLLIGNKADTTKNTVYRALISDLAGVVYDVSPAAAGISWVNATGTRYKLVDFSTLFPSFDFSLAPLTWLKVYNKTYTLLTAAPGASDEGCWWYDDTLDILHIHLDHLTASHDPEDEELTFSAAPLKIRCGTGATWFDLNKNVPFLDGGIQEMIVIGKDVVLFSDTNAARLKWIGGFTVLGEAVVSPLSEESVFIQDGQGSFVRAFMLQNILIGVWDKGIFALAINSDSFEPLLKGEEFNRLTTTLRGTIIGVGICYAQRQLLIQVSIPFHDYPGGSSFYQRFFLVSYEDVHTLLDANAVEIFEYAMGQEIDGVGDSLSEPVVFHNMTAYALREHTSYGLGSSIDYDKISSALEPVLSGTHANYYRYHSYNYGAGTTVPSYLPIALPFVLGGPSDVTTVLARIPDGNWFHGSVVSTSVDGATVYVIAGFDYEDADSSGLPANTELWLNNSYHYLKVTVPIEDKVVLKEVLIPLRCEESFNLYCTITSEEGRLVKDYKTVPTGRSVVRFPIDMEGAVFILQLAVPVPKPWVADGIYLNISPFGAVR